MSSFLEVFRSSAYRKVTEGKMTVELDKYLQICRQRFRHLILTEFSKLAFHPPPSLSTEIWSRPQRLLKVFLGGTNI